MERVGSVVQRSVVGNVINLELSFSDAVDVATRDRIVYWMPRIDR